MRRAALYMIFVLCLLQANAFAQQAKYAKAVPYLKVAEREYNDQRYSYAIPFYKAILKLHMPNDSSILAHIAESYWQIKSYDSARTYYQYFEKKYGVQFFSSRRLAELAASQKRYSDAAEIYQNIRRNYSSISPDWIDQRLKGFSNVEPFLKDSLDYMIRLLRLNTGQQDFSPQYYKGGMVFVSNRYTKAGVEKEFGWDGLPFANIYWVKDTSELFSLDTLPPRIEHVYNSSIKANDDYTARTSNDNDIIIASSMHGAYNGGEIHKLAKFTDELNAKYNYGPLCFNKTGTKVYFTRNSLKPYKGRYNLEICEATLVNHSWGPVKVLPFVDPAFDFYHPALNGSENRLYFCSNRPGGKGGSDIYYVSLATDSAMRTAIPLDDKINTAGDELFPTMHGDTLYFSSDGWAGLGGLDIYKTVQEGNTWKTPVNLGYPINSSFDDFGIIFANGTTKGHFTSNRLGSDDIFAFDNGGFNMMQLSGIVLDKSNMRRLESAKVVIREVINGKTTQDSLLTNYTGNFKFPLKTNHNYYLWFSKDGYTKDSVDISKSAVAKDIELKPILLAPIPKPAPPPPVQVVVVKDSDGDGVEDSKDKCPDKKGTKENFGCPDIQARLNELAKMVFFKTASAELSPAALKPLNEAVEILNEYPNTTLAIEGHTDNRAGAAYNKDLSQRRANSVKAFFVGKGLKESRFTSVVGYGLERPIATNDTEEGRALNRRVSIKATFVY